MVLRRSLRCAPEADEPPAPPRRLRHPPLRVRGDAPTCTRAQCYRCPTRR